MSKEDILGVRDHLARFRGCGDWFHGRGDVAALASDLEWALDEVERLDAPPWIASRAGAARDRLARVLSGKDRSILCSTVAVLASDLEWALDEIERLRDTAAPASPPRPRKSIPLVEITP